MSDFPYQAVLRTILSSPSNPNIFDSLIQALEDHHARPLTTLSQVKHRDSMKVKGLTWEILCQQWLLYSRNYSQVWLLNQVPPEVLASLGLTNSRGQVTRMDNGIDLIALSSSGYTAIQCKYRSGKTKLNWATLSTFIGLCSTSGPWFKCTVMTNTKSITTKIKRPPNHNSICYQSFANTPREVWLKIAGDYVEHRLIEGKAPKPLAVQVMRELRVSKLSIGQGDMNAGIPECKQAQPSLHECKQAQPSLHECKQAQTSTPTSDNSIHNLPSNIQELREARLARFQG